jgi:hypothetical protein
MITPRKRAGRLSGAITAATITMALGGPLIHWQAHLAAAQAAARTATAAILCPPPAVVAVTSSSGDPGC